MKAIVAALSITAGFLILGPAPQAHAGGYGCSGSLVGSWPVPMKDVLTGGTYYRSDVKLYYDASTGWNCAALVKREGPRYGEITPMSIFLFNGRCAEDNKKNNCDDDTGHYKYYAGPVKVYGKGMCIGFVARASDGRTSQDWKGDYNGYLFISGVACR
ncbi:hypothetical protein [Streptomyces zingiberis]|uniref:Spore-associated protein A n=1 Tax=Streptomyces zingiberis TaxID=2053010 RepID=A0ABX1BS00_9ACTN|nr:hypothetical protein [Streptomyces zingiberis]NJQ00497.1 hypothetical protein [Streptomyces zingiberis]